MELPWWGSVFTAVIAVIIEVVACSFNFSFCPSLVLVSLAEGRAGFSTPLQPCRNDLQLELTSANVHKSGRPSSRRRGRISA